MAERFYRHNLGLLPNQRRAWRQVRAGRLAARSSYAVFLSIVLLAVLPLPLNLALPEGVRTGVVVSLTAVLIPLGAVVITVAITRSKLPAAHRFHTQAARAAWFLLPLGGLAALLASALGPGWLLIAALFAGLGVVALCDATLARVQVAGRYDEANVCVVDLRTGSRDWQKESDLATLDEAAQIVAASLDTPDDDPESAGSYGPA